MSFKDRLKTVEFEIDGRRRRLIGGSFRGVPFFVESHSMAAGRRVQSSEFFRGTVAFTEDLGRTVRTYSLAAYLVGTDAITNRDKLIQALETPGPGLLVHPYLGETLAQAGDYTLTESKNEGGVHTFALNFIEAAEISPLAEAAPDNAAKTATAAAAVTEISKQEFSKNVSIADIFEDLVENVESALNAALDAINGAREKARRVAAFQSRLNGIAEDLRLALLTADALADDLVFLIGFEPTAAVSAADLAVSAGIYAEDTAPRVRLQELARLASYPIAPIPAGLTDSELRAARSAFFIAQITAAAALAALAAGTAGLTFETRNQAQDFRNQIRDAGDAILGVCSDEMFDAIASLLAAADAALADASLNLEPVIEKTLDLESDILSIAWDVYADANRAAEILAQNPGIIHPGYIPKGSILRLTAK